MLRIISGLVLASFLAGCDSSSPSTDNQPPLLPLEVGNEWIMSRVDSLGSTGTFTVGHATVDTISVDRDTTIDGERWFYLTSRKGFGIPGAKGARPWYTLRDNGLWRMAGRHSEEFIPVHILPYPSESGDFLTPQTGINHTRTASDTTVSVNGIGPVNAVPFAMRLYEGFEVTGEFWEGRSLQGSSTLVNVFSPEWGFIEAHMHYVGIDPENDQYLAIVGRATLKLLEFRRAQIPTDSESASIRYSRDDRRGTHHGGRVLYPVGN